MMIVAPISVPDQSLSSELIYSNTKADSEGTWSISIFHDGAPAFQAVASAAALGVLAVSLRL